jgi:hypothetical protein
VLLLLATSDAAKAFEIWVPQCCDSV